MSVTVRRIKEIRVPASPAPWSPAGNKAQMLVLDDGSRFEMYARDMAGVVPIAGDFLVRRDKGHEIFQLYKIARTEMRPTGEIHLVLTNGSRVGPEERNPYSVVPQIGDYLVRKTDGYHTVRQRDFEQEFFDVLHALKEQAKKQITAPVRAKKAKGKRLRRAARLLRERWGSA